MNRNVDLSPLLLTEKEEEFVRVLGIKYFPDMCKYLFGKTLTRKYPKNTKEIESIREIVSNLNGVTEAEKRANIPRGFLTMYFESDIRMSRIYVFRLLRLSSVILKG